MRTTAKIIFVCLSMSLVIIAVMMFLLDSKASNEQNGSTITVFAASGMTNAIEELGRLYEMETGVKVVCNLDSSSRLARQIQAGAQADIFISANDKWIDFLQDNNLVAPANRKALVSTDLVLIVPNDSIYSDNVRFDSNFAESFTGSLAIGDYTHVPAGVYAKQSMDKLGVFEHFEDKLALCSNVSAALRFVEIGQCQAGIVYMSSAISSSKVRIAATISCDVHAPVIFTAAVCNRQNKAAFEFLEFLNAPKNSKLFACFGFKTPKQHGIEPYNIVTANTAAFFLNEDEWSVLKLSIKVASFCVVLITVPGIAMGWFLARAKFRGKMLLEALVHLPLIMPPVVTGYLALVMLSKKSFIGGMLYDHFGISLPFTWYAAVITSAIMGIPLLIRSVKLAVQLIDQRLEKAASTLGATPLKVFITVTLPLALPGIISGLILAFARSLGEFGATATFAGNIPGKTRTLSLAIHSLTQIPSREDSVIKLVCISITISVLALLFSDLMSRRLLARTGAISHD